MQCSTVLASVAITNTTFLTNITDLETVKEPPNVLFRAPACGIDVVRGGVPECETEREPF